MNPRRIGERALVMAGAFGLAAIVQRWPRASTAALIVLWIIAPGPDSSADADAIHRAGKAWRHGARTVMEPEASV